MNRRAFVKSASFGLAALGSRLAASPYEAGRKPGTSETAGRQRGKTGHPNIIVILADDLGYGSLGCYGATKVKTPNIDRLAREGVRFTNAHGPSSVCTPSRFGLLTGCYAWRSVPPENRRSQWEQWHRDPMMKGDRWIGHVAVEPNEPLLIGSDRLTLPSLLRSAGYATACVGKWHLGFGQPDQVGWSAETGPDWNSFLPRGPLDVGFDYYFGFPIVNSSEPKVFIENRHVVGLDPADPIRLKTAYNRYGRLQYQMQGGTSARIPQDQFDVTTTRKALDWIEGASRADKPFFLYFALSNPHWPFKPPPEYADTSELGPRGDVMHEMDGSVGAIMKKLEELGIADNTLIMFSSDHGAEASSAVRHIHPEVDGHRLNGPLLGGKTEIHEGGNRVPFVLRWPARVRAGVESTSLVALTDLVATCSEIVGQSLPRDGAEDSFSFLPEILPGHVSANRRETLIADSMLGLLALYEGPWKYIPEAGHGGYFPLDPGPTPGPHAPPAQLYNLEADLGESVNLYRKHPEIVARMEAKLEEIKLAGRSRS